MQKKIKRGQKLLPKKSSNRGQVRATSSSYGEKNKQEKQVQKSDFPQEASTSTSIGENKKTPEKQVQKRAFPEDGSSSSSIGDQKEENNQDLADKNSGISKSDIAVTVPKAKRVRQKDLNEDEINTLLFPPTNNTTSVTTVNTTTISTSTTSTNTRKIQLGLPRTFKGKK